MERIAKLLFATTALWIFSVALIFAMNLVAGNGGEYWGFNGRIEPRHAARNEFEAGEYRFLAYELHSEYGGTQRGFPNVYRCDFHSTVENGHVRFNEISARHGYDSVSKADRFARRYNDVLASYIRMRTDHYCEAAGSE